MIESANDHEDGHTIAAEVCVVGAGIAGITLALRLARENVGVCLIEGGGERYSRRSQALYDGLVTTPPYSLTGTRTRMLGGSSNCWGGWTRPLRAADFAGRPWVGDGSGWPIGEEDVAPYYDDAARLLQVMRNEPDAARRAALAPAVAEAAALGGDTFAPIFFEMSPRTAFGRIYRGELAAARSLRVVLDATATRLLTDPASDAVVGLEARSERGRLRVNARTFVLAAGGIENPRLLLASGGIGNGADLVGRYFMDHPRIRLQHVLLPRGSGLATLYDMRPHGGGTMVGRREILSALMAASPEEQRRAGVLQCYTGLIPCYVGVSDSTLEDARHTWKALCNQPHEAVDLKRAAVAAVTGPLALAYYAGRRMNLRGAQVRFELKTVIEPLPDRDNRVELAAETDRHGVPKVRLTWRRHELERKTHRHAVGLFTKAMARAGYGRSTIPAGVWEPAAWQARTRSTWHHMGTTRMAASPAQGVVDLNGRVFGVPNLYVAGSSIFPTGGGSPPTFTIAALVLRLAEHLLRA